MSKKKRNWKPATQLVHSGTLRSQHRRDVGSDLPDAGLCLRHRRSRRGALQGRGARLHLFALRQPDRRHVREAHVRAGRRGGCPRHGVGHGGRHGGDPVQPQGRRPHRCGARAVRLLPLGDRDAGAEIRHRGDAGRRHRHRELGKGGPPEHQAVLPRKPDQPDARSDRHRGGGRARQFDRRAAGRRQRLRHAAAAEAARARRAYRRLFGDQAHRRPGPLPRRHRALRQGVDRQESARLFPPHRAEPVALQRLDAAQGAGDAAGQGAPADGERRQDRRLPGRPAGDCARHLSRPRRPSAGRYRQEADDAAARR